MKNREKLLKILTIIRDEVDELYCRAIINEEIDKPAIKKNLKIKFNKIEEMLKGIEEIINELD